MIGYLANRMWTSLYFSQERLHTEKMNNILLSSAREKLDSWSLEIMPNYDVIIFEWKKRENLPWWSPENAGGGAGMERIDKDLHVMRNGCWMFWSGGDGVEKGSREENGV